MKKFLVMTSLLLLLCSSCFRQEVKEGGYAKDFRELLVKTYGLNTDGYDFYKNSAFDSKGNLYVAGNFKTSILVDGNLYSVRDGDFSDIALWKVSPDGDIAWVKIFSSLSADNVRAVSVDENDFIYLGGQYKSDILFDDILLTEETGGTSAFLARLTTDGEVLWAKSFTSSGINNFQIVEFDILSTGNIVFTGKSANPTLFYNGEAFHSTGSENVIVGEITPHGDPVWIKQIAGSSAFLVGISIKADSQGNVYISGRLDGPVTFNGKTDEAEFIKGMFVAKYSSMGEEQWIYRPTVTSTGWAWDLEVDDEDNVYVGSLFTGDITLPSGEAFTSAGNQDGLLLKLDGKGNLMWSKQLGASSFDVIYNLCLFEKNIYVSGTTSAGFNYDGSFYSVTNSSNRSSYLLSVKSSDGSAVKFYENSGSGDVYGRSIMSYGGYIYQMGGYKNDFVDLNNRTHAAHTSEGGVFMMRLLL